MENAMKWALIMLLVATASLAQPLRVFSEFAEINAQGTVAAPESPREILSPAIVRNGFTSFQVVIQVPKGAPFTLHVGQNPADAVNVALYRESGEHLERVELPYQSASTQVLWMDLWVDREAPVRRIKVEPQLFIDGDWVVYPMEARVVAATVPEGDPNGAPLTWMQQRFCGLIVDVGPSRRGPALLTAARFRARNAQQDVLLASRVADEDLNKLMGSCKIPADPEWYLRIRDYLWRLR
jgi:hypothetical protein